jgi:hypothetical protein
MMCLARACVVVAVLIAGSSSCGPADPVIELDTRRGGAGGGGEGEGEGEGEAGTCDAIEGAALSSIRIPLLVPRSRHSATLLDDGRVLLVGGEDDDFLPTASVEIVDVDAGISTAGPSLAFARYEHAAAKLADGSVVVAGGFGAGGHLDSVERFDGTAWTTLDPLDAARAGLSGVALDDGRALFFGGDNGTAIPTTAVVVDGSVVSTAAGVDIGANRRLHAATKLADGRVFIAGGFFTSAIDTTVFVSADATTSEPGPALPGARRQAMIAPLPDGGAVVVGGLGGGGILDDILRLTATGAALLGTGTLSAPRHSGRALALGCGVVVCGGLGSDGPVSTCEGIDEVGRPVPMQASLPAPTFSFSFTALDEHRALVAGGSLPDGHVATAVVLTLAP